ncbi:MAG: insulinase family protein [Candidatus Aminicenantes bacterium]|nr:MAG: insulinase family protein [Candidatus Aminicenantes bacterium]
MNSRVRFFVFVLALILLVPFGCKKAAEEVELKIDYEKYTLANGLEVVLHEDKSDPIAAVAVQYHVGSNREEVGRTGFAHLFEHMMFQESQHVGQDQFFKKIQAAGGMLNGGTNRDGTIYFQVVPKNALEMVLWLEADRLGFLTPTITKEAFANQQNVVKNEKRQGENRPYGYTSHIVGKLLYPEGHPYNWTVIGSMADLTLATLKDVHEFHGKWYRPNNATLVVAGDFDKEQTKLWIEKYYGEIKSGEKKDDPKPQLVTLDKIKMAYWEDKYANTPELNMIVPTVESYHPDDYALSGLGYLFSYGKKAPLYKVIVEEKKLAPSVSGFQMSNEIAGEFRIRIRTFPKVDLDDVKAAIEESFQRFETESFTEEDVKRIKAGLETQFYNGISSILGKSFQLARYNEYAGSPGYVTQDLENIKAVTKEDILRVYETYIKGKPYVMTSFVPMGQLDLIVEGSESFTIEEEAAAAEKIVTERGVEEFKVEPISTSFDRSQEPPIGPDPEITLPTIWKDELSNGIKIYGIEHTELPLVQFSMTIKGGQLLDDMDKVGVAHLITDMMMEGTKNRTPLELEEAIDELGAYINMYTSREAITISVNCLMSKFNDVYQLVEEILLEPRWDEKEFDRIKKQTVENINRSKVRPTTVARNVFNKLIYGNNHIFSIPTLGTVVSVDAITIDDLKAYYEKNLSPSFTHVGIVGNISQQDAVSKLRSLEEKWAAKDVTFPEFELPASTEKSMVYFVDFPGARQSVIYIGNLAMPATDPDYYPAYVMNYKLGGSFNGFVNLILREEKGYTYGARTVFSGSLQPGTFIASSQVQSQATLESVQIFRDLMLKYREGIAPEDMKFTKDALVKSNARNFETLGALLGILNNIATYNRPDDYIKQREEFVKNLTPEAHKELAQKHIDPDRMIYLVVGDAATQMKALEKLGFGDVTLIEQK